jgi:DNA-binding LacI/PurR family transcriptional regulator
MRARLAQTRACYHATGCMTDAVNTVADIARLAGVSKSTVSRALNDSPLIGAPTKERIRAIAEEHHFRINASARRLSLKQSNTVAFVTYTYEADFSVPDVFMLEIMSGISNALHDDHYDMLVVQVDPNDTEWARQYLDTGRVDGFILLAATCTQRHIETLVELNAPFVLWGDQPRHGERYCSISGDSFAGGKLATEQLLGSGRERIAFLGGPADEQEVRDRFGGYEAALGDADLKVDAALVLYTDYTPASAAAAMAELLERAPELDGVFANSDLMAIAAMDTIRAAGRTVPEDVAVVGYDDVSIARHSNPPLTTIRQNGPLAGRLLAQSLVHFLQTGTVTNTTIPAELVVRESA